MGRSLADVRVHDDATADALARTHRARAVTYGQDVFLRRDVARLATPRDLGTLVHEVAHTQQQIDPSREDYDVARLEGEARSAVDAVFSGRSVSALSVAGPHFAKEDDDDDFKLDLGLLAKPQAVVAAVRKKHPQYVVVDIGATRKEIAKALYGNEKMTFAFDFIDHSTLPSVELDPKKERLVQPRLPGKLIAEVTALMRPMMEGALRDDIAWTIAKLSERSIDDADSWELTRMALLWSQRSQYLDKGGVGYFDRYLQELFDRKLSQPHWYTFTLTETTKRALDWLLIETGWKSEQIKKAIALRSARYKTGYRVTDAKPSLSRGDVIGRFYWSGKRRSGLQLFVLQTLVVGPDRRVVEVYTRNSRFKGIRVIVRGSDGLYYSYAVVHRALDLMVRGPTEGAKGEFFWYYPDTTYIPAGNTGLDYDEGGAVEKSTRKSILDNAILNATKFDPAELTRLELDVLALATPPQRASMIRTVMSSPAAKSSAAVGFYSRVLLSTPNKEFHILERFLSTKGVISEWLKFDQATLLSLGRAFTIKSVGALAIGGAAFDKLPSFWVGKKSDTFRYGFGVPQTVKSRLVGGKNWKHDDAPTLKMSRHVPGRERAMAGEAERTIDRTAIYFDLGKKDDGYFDKPRREPKVGPFLPTQLLLIHIEGKTTTTRIVSAFEAAALASAAATAMLKKTSIDLIALNLWARAGLGLGRAFAPALARGLAIGGVRGGLTALAVAAGTEAGKAALKSFFVEAVLVASMQIVEGNRDELSTTAEGRTFLAIYDTAMIALMAYGAWRLLSSGIVKRLASYGWRALRSLPAAMQGGLRKALLELEALTQAMKTLRARGELMMVTENGVTYAVPKNQASFRVAYITARGDTAAKAVVGRVSGTLATRAQKVLDTLKNAATSSKNAARAYRDVAAAAGKMTAVDADVFLQNVEKLLATRANHGHLANLVRAAAANPTQGFIDSAIWLASQRGIAAEALEVLGKKAIKGSVDLPWLQSRSMGTRLINFLGKDPKTPWNLLKRAAANPNDVKLRIQVLTRIRGIAAERVADQSPAAFPNYRITGRQAAVGKSELDFRLVSTDGRGASAFAEIKGWTQGTWQKALDAFEKRLLGSSLTKEEAAQVGKIDGMLKQLRDATAAGKDAPFLAHTDALPKAMRLRIQRLLSGQGLGNVQLSSLSESEILAIGRALRKGAGIQ